MIVSKKKSFFFHASILFLIVSVLFTTASTFAKYVQRAVIEDSAVVAVFDVQISAPEELEGTSSEAPFLILLFETEETKSFLFSVENKSEVSIVCRPFISNDVTFEVLVAEESCESFFVGMGESIDFQIVISTEGLNRHSKEATLVVEIYQAEGD